MPVEEIISEIRKQDDLIRDAMKKRDELLHQLEETDSESYDWLSVKKAAEVLQVSLGMIYKRIDKGDLQVKYIGSKKFVKKSEIFAINDK